MAALGLMTSQVVAETVEYRGALCFTFTNPTCVADGEVAGDCFFARMRPPGLGDNGPATKLSFFGQAGAENFTLPNGSLIGTTFRNVNATHIGGSGYAYSATMRFTRQVPNVPTADTVYMNVEGTITNFADVTGCNLSFRATLTQRP
jgi:hypothetical protein